MPTRPIGMTLGAPFVVVSGVECWPLAADEQILLTAYRLLCMQGAGSLHLQMAQQRVTEFKVLPDVGSAAAMNQARKG